MIIASGLLSPENRVTVQDEERLRSGHFGT